MTVYRYTKDSIIPLANATFSSLKIGERNDLQRLLRDKIEIIAPDTLVIAEEFFDWDDSRRRIDLLAIDRDAKLVVIELKRTEDGGHMDLQAIRYAAMVSTITFADSVRIFGDYLKQRCDNRDANQTILDFLGWTEPLEGFANDVRIVLVSADFGKEVTTAVLWLLEKDVDIRCVRVKPYGTTEQTLLDIQQVIPLPEAREYQIRVREKKELERITRTALRDNTRYQVSVNGQLYEYLPKRRAVLQIVKSIVAAGISPEVLQKDITWQYLYFKASGQLSGEQIEAAILAEGRTEAKRYFTLDSELLQHCGDTYAISNQWGPRTMEAIERMQNCCPSISIVCEPMS